MSSAAQYFDRSMRLGHAHRVSTAWIPIHRVRLDCTDRMAVGDVQNAYNKVLHNGPECATWPCPVGWWDGEVFVISDGRHEFSARLMLGQRRIFVAWVESANDQVS